MLISLCVSSFSILSQSQKNNYNGNSVFSLEELNPNIEFSNDPENSAYTQQIGDENIAQITSIQTVNDSEDMINIGQYGTKNEATIDHLGEQQKINVFQLGLENDAIINSEGSNIYSVAVQVGSQNYVKQDIKNDGESDKIIATAQFGSSNSIDIQSIENSSNVVVVQQGSNNELSLNMDKKDATNPISVEQSMGGKATITQSAFYTPMKTY